MIEDAILGRLLWDRDLQWWSGEIEFGPGQWVGVHVAPEDQDIREVLPRAHRSFAWVQEHEDFARRCVADKLLSLFNTHWSSEGPISQEEFLERIELVEINFSAEGSIYLWYDGEDLFGGHLISVSFDPEGRFQRAGLEG
jgi:hypothetical protein